MCSSDLKERKLFCFYGDSDALVQVTVHFKYSSIMHGRTRESKRLKRSVIFYIRTHGDRKKKIVAFIGDLGHPCELFEISSRIHQH